MAASQPSLKTAAAQPGSAKAASAPLWKDIAIGISLANLMFVRISSQILTFTAGDAYTMKRPPSPAMYAATMLDISFVGAAITLVIRLGRAARRRWFHKFAPFIAVAFMALPLNSIRGTIGTQGLTVGPMLLVKQPVLLAVIAIASAPLIIAAVIRWPQRVLAVIGGVLLIFSPLAPVVFAQALWKMASYDPSAYADKPVAPAFAGRPQRRVVWAIFDEWDYRLTFAGRPPGLALPEIDRFSTESLFSTHAYTPGGETIVSMPALLTGRLVATTNQVSQARLDVLYEGARQYTDWMKQPNVFSDARELRLNTAVVGWFHPYCRGLTANLTSCWNFGDAPANFSFGETLPALALNELRSLVESVDISPFGQSVIVQAHTRFYRDMLDRALSVAADPRYGLVFLHLPVPHSPHSYNRRTGKFDLGNEPFRGYIDSLALADRTLGELRTELERAGLWNSTVLLLSSDHCDRTSEGIDGKKDHRVPFIVHLPGGGITYDAAFNTVLTRNFIAAILHHEVNTTAEAAAWLEKHRTIADSPYNPD